MYPCPALLTSTPPSSSALKVKTNSRPPWSVWASKGLLQSLSGIRARRFWEGETQPSEVATQAAQAALDKANVAPEQIGALINTSVCRDYIEPSTACLVHGNLNLPEDCLNYDLGNACLGFMNGMDAAAQMIENGAIDHALIVDGESNRFPIAQTIERLSDNECTEMDFRSQFATLTLGSGAAAMVLSRRQEGDDLPPIQRWRELCRDGIQSHLLGPGR